MTKHQETVQRMLHSSPLIMPEFGYIGIANIVKEKVKSIRE